MTYNFDLILEILEQIKKIGTVSIHHASILLQYAIEESGAETKRDLCDGDQMTIKTIREIIKGL